MEFVTDGVKHVVEEWPAGFEVTSSFNGRVIHSTVLRKDVGGVTADDKVLRIIFDMVDNNHRELTRSEAGVKEEIK
ncbi:hypothetical protein ACHHV8_11090 [Paenibacillus sp. TAB 01]|uniref:hypothetical protein n=1 Tax=Paenibacillus sp. TAB 01 TaxID=3368988 RepID=UPI003751432B